MKTSNTGKQMLTEANYKILKCLLSGKFLRASVTDEKRGEIEKETGYGNVDVTIRKLEEMGFVSGYVPILTEKGAKMLEYAKLLFEATGEESDGLEQLMDGGT